MRSIVSPIEIDTPHGPAHAYLYPAEAPDAALVLGHGAAGGVRAPDLVAVTDAARAENISVALVEQPYRVAGRRSPARAPQLDAAWIVVVERLHQRELAGLSLVVGGRSLGARRPNRQRTADRDRRDEHLPEEQPHISLQFSRSPAAADRPSQLNY